VSYHYSAVIWDRYILCAILLWKFSNGGDEMLQAEVTQNKN